MKRRTQIILGIALLGIIFACAFFPYDTDDADQVVREAYGDDIFAQTQTPMCTSDGVGLKRVLFGVMVTHCETQWFVLFNLFAFNNFINNEKQNEALSQAQREALVSSYIEENISIISPEPEVLGGTFYVTNIEFSGTNSGTVEYEDGHIALIADFEYSINKEGAVEIELTNVRESQP